MYKTIYTKYSNERAPRFSVMTMICQDENGKKLVRKKAASQAAGVHLEEIRRLYEELKNYYKGSGISINRCSGDDRCLELEFLEGHTYEAEVDHILLSKGPDAALEAIDKYLHMMIDDRKQIPFEESEELQQIFGEHPAFPPETMSLLLSDIDMIMANLILSGERRQTGIMGLLQKKTLIDYEWTFRFPIPIGYLKFRILHYYVERENYRQILKEKDIYGRFGITQNDRVTYLQMENVFQRYTEGEHVAVHNMYEDLTPGVCQTSIYTGRSKGHVQKGWLHLFWTNDGIHRIVDSYRTIFTDGEIQTVFPVPAGMKELRIDPGEEPCIVRIRSIRPVSRPDKKLQDRLFHHESDRHVQWKAETVIRSNGRRAGENLLVFDHHDPQIYVELSRNIEDAEGETVSGACSLEIAMEVLWLGQDVLEAVLRGADSSGELPEQNTEAVIEEQIITSKMWK
ncbi:MAG: hypothetical protein Q4B22_09130 [Eubacteriales bacterium]|nr:hypothetical protein [Eubacteriales bacterium]